MSCFVTFRANFNTRSGVPSSDFLGRTLARGSDLRLEVEGWKNLKIQPWNFLDSI